MMCGWRAVEVQETSGPGLAAERLGELDLGH